MIYLDHNATTPVDERVVESMLPYLSSFYGNPSSLYRAGRVVRSAIDTAREQVAALVDAQPAQIVFTSGGTESNNLALSCVALNYTQSANRIAVSAVEHPSILEPAFKATQLGECALISVDGQGRVSLSDVESLFQRDKSPNLVSVMLANNENGVVQDIMGVSQILRDHNVLFHTDAVQAVGKIPVYFSRLGVDLMSLSSHKIYGPKGCGALIMNKKDYIQPLLVGGGQEKGYRAGTENVAAIVGFGKAAELALLELEPRAEHCLVLKKQLEQELNTIPGLVVFAEKAERLPNTVQFGVENIDGEMLLMQLDKKNIAVSSGSACTSGGGKASSVLTAMGVDSQLAKSAIRISLGKATTELEIKEFIKVLKLSLGIRT